MYSFQPSSLHKFAYNEVSEPEKFPGTRGACVALPIIKIAQRALPLRDVDEMARQQGCRLSTTSYSKQSSVLWFDKVTVTVGNWETETATKRNAPMTFKYSISLNFQFP